MGLPHVVLTEAYSSNWRSFLEFYGYCIELDQDEIARVGSMDESLEEHPRLLSQKPLIITSPDLKPTRCLESIERNGEVSLTFFTRDREEYECMQSLRHLMEKSGVVKS